MFYNTLLSRSLRSRQLIPDSREEASAAAAPASAGRMEPRSAWPRSAGQPGPGRPFWDQSGLSRAQPATLQRDSAGGAGPPATRGVPKAPTEQMTSKWRWAHSWTWGLLGGEVCGNLTHSSGLGLLLLGRSQGRLPPATVSTCRALRRPAWAPHRTRPLPPRAELSQGVSRALWGGSQLNISLMAPREGSHTPQGLCSRGRAGGQLCSSRVTGCGSSGQVAGRQPPPQTAAGVSPGQAPRLVAQALLWRVRTSSHSRTHPQAGLRVP